MAPGKGCSLFFSSPVTPLEKLFEFQFKLRDPRILTSAHLLLLYYYMYMKIHYIKLWKNPHTEEKIINSYDIKHTFMPLV